MVLPLTHAGAIPGGYGADDQQYGQCGTSIDYRERSARFCAPGLRVFETRAHSKPVPKRSRWIRSALLFVAPGEIRLWPQENAAATNPRSPEMGYFPSSSRRVCAADENDESRRGKRKREPAR